MSLLSEKLFNSLYGMIESNSEKPDYGDAIKTEYNKLNEEDKKEVIDTANSVIINLMKILGVEDYEKYLVKDEDLSEGVLIKQITIDKSSEPKVEDDIDGNPIDSCQKKEEPQEARFVTKEEYEQNKSLLENCWKVEDVNGKKVLNLASKSNNEDGSEWYNVQMPVKKSPEYEFRKGDILDPTIEKGAKVAADGKLYYPANPYVDNSDSSMVSKKADDKSEFAPELLDPTIRKKPYTDAKGKVWEPANPYAGEIERFPHIQTLEKNETNMEYMKNNKSVFEDLKKEYENEYEVDTEATIEDLVTSIIRLVSNKKDHNYKIIPSSKNSPASVEVIVKDVSNIVLDRYDILESVSNELKETYQFPNVYYLNTPHTPDDGLIDLIYYLALE